MLSAVLTLQTSSSSLDSSSLSDELLCFDMLFWAAATACSYFACIHMLAVMQQKMEKKPTLLGVFERLQIASLYALEI